MSVMFNKFQPEPVYVSSLVLNCEDPRMKDFRFARYLRLKESVTTHLPTVLGTSWGFGLTSTFTTFSKPFILNENLHDRLCQWGRIVESLQLFSCLSHTHTHTHTLLCSSDSKINNNYQC